MASSDSVTSAGAPNVAMVPNRDSSPNGVRTRSGTWIGLGRTAGSPGSAASSPRSSSWYSTFRDLNCLVPQPTSARSGR